MDREKRKEFLEKRELQKIERLNKVRKRKGLEEIKPPSEIAGLYFDVVLIASWCVFDLIYFKCF